MPKLGNYFFFLSWYRNLLQMTQQFLIEETLHKQEVGMNLQPSISNRKIAVQCAVLRQYRLGHRMKMGRIVICILSNLFCLTYVQRNNNLIFKVSDDCNCKSFLTVQEHFIRAFFIVLRAFLQHLIWLQVISVIGNVLQKWHI